VALSNNALVTIEAVDGSGKIDSQVKLVNIKLAKAAR
jgi:hypothetical protein